MTANARSLLWYAGALLLVPVYVQTFPLWTALARGLGAGGASLFPFLAAATAFATYSFFIRQRILLRQPVNRLAVGGAVLCAAAALLATDPQFPAKRIHVAEYLLLAFVVHQAVRHHVSARALPFVIALTVAVLGVHDEMIQGLHPDRSFGLRDVLVDALSGTAGALLCASFKSETPVAPSAEIPWFDLVLLSLGVATLILPLQSYRHDPIPWWTLTPLLAAGALWCARPLEDRPPPPWRALAWLSVSLAFYPVAAHVLALDFN